MTGSQAYITHLSMINFVGIATSFLAEESLVRMFAFLSNVNFEDLREKAPPDLVALLEYVSMNLFGTPEGDWRR